MGRRAAAFAFLAAVGTPLSAGAQSTDPTPPAAAAAQVSQGPMVVERIKSGWVVAPEFKMTDFDDKVSPMIGVYGGWLTDQTFFVGAGASFLADPSYNRELGYGGLVLGWTFHPDRQVGYGIRSLVGGGHSVRTAVVNTYYVPPFVPGPFPTPYGRRNGAYVPPPPSFVNTTVIFHDDFFVFEPEASASVKLHSQFRLVGSFGYRLAAGERNTISGLNGALGSVSLQIGGGS